jgi:hypothetical protein
MQGCEEGSNVRLCNNSQICLPEVYSKESHWWVFSGMVIGSELGI